MADAVPPTGDVESLARAVDAARRELDGLNAARRAGSVVRLLLLVALVAFAGATLFSFWRLWQLRTSRAALDEFAAEARKRLEANRDGYLKQARLLVRTAGPKLTDALYRQAEKDLPAYLAAVGEQREAFRNDLEAKLAARLDGGFREALARHEGELRQEFPALADKAVRARLEGSLAAAADGVARRYLVRELRQEMDTLYATWDAFPPAEPPAPGGEPLMAQLDDALYRVLVRKFAYSDAARR